MTLLEIQSLTLENGETEVRRLLSAPNLGVSQALTNLVSCPDVMRSRASLVTLGYVSGTWNVRNVPIIAIGSSLIALAHE